MVSLYSPPNPDLLKATFNTLRSCTAGDSVKVIEVKHIRAIIAMVPHQPFGTELEQCYFVVEKSGLEVAELAGQEEEVPADE